MRPIKLQLEGFSGFRDRTEVDFTDVELVAFVGPTGSGKSSIIDGIVFALYGSIPRYDNENLVAPVIHTLATEAKVQLDFEIGDQQYSAVRIVRRMKGGGASTREARLELLNGGVLAGSAPEMRSKVPELIGLTFDQFTKTVVLPQGAFAAFLHDKPANRQALLRKLLDLEVYARMAKTANTRATTANTKIGVLTEQIEQRLDLSPEGLRALDTRVVDLEVARRSLDTILERHQLASERSRATARTLAQLESSLAILKQVKVPKGISELDATLKAAQTEAESAKEEATISFAARDAAQTAVDVGPDRGRCERWRHDHTELGEIEKQMPGAKERAKQARLARNRAIAGREDAESEVAEASDRVDAARTRAGATSLIQMLEVGTPCPVCNQTVLEVPGHDPDAELTAAEETLAEARRASTAASKAATAAEKTLLEAAGQVELLEQRGIRLWETLEDAPDLETVEQQIAEAKDLAVTLAAAALAASDAERRRSAAEGLVAKVQARGQKARKELEGARDALATLGPPALAADGLEDGWKRLIVWTETMTVQLVEDQNSQAAKATAAESDRGAAERDLDTLCEPLGIVTTVAKASTDFAAAEASAVAAAETYRAQLAELADLGKQVAALEVEHSVARQLGQLLSATGFERWLLAEALHELGERASERLAELSGGQYTLEADADAFVVCDHRNADERRDVKTLSGGETFLASLALALALADGIRDLASDSTPRLDSVFLDEGFGTLDPDTLDMVSAAIEELGSSGRMVGIVTHIRDLAERMPTRFEVAKDSRTSTVARVEV